MHGQQNVKICIPFTFSKYFPLLSPPSSSEAKYNVVLVTGDLVFINKAGITRWVCPPSDGTWLRLLFVQKQVSLHYSDCARLQLECDGTRWRKGGEVKGKPANGVGSQYSSHYLGTWCIQHLLLLMLTPWLPVVDWTDAPADLNGLVRFTERRNLVSALVPSHFKRSILSIYFLLFMCDLMMATFSGRNM